MEAGPSSGRGYERRDWISLGDDSDSSSSDLSDVSDLIPSLAYPSTSRSRTPPTPPFPIATSFPLPHPSAAPRHSSELRPQRTRSLTPLNPPTPPKLSLPKLRPPTPTASRADRAGMIAPPSYSRLAIGPGCSAPRPRSPTPDFVPPPPSTAPWRLPLARAFFLLPSDQEPHRSIETFNLLSSSEQDTYASMIRDTFAAFSSEVVGARHMILEYEESESTGEERELSDVEHGEVVEELGWVVDDVGIFNGQQPEEVEEDEFGYRWLLEGGTKKRRRGVGLTATTAERRGGAGAVLGTAKEEYDDEGEVRKRRKGKGRIRRQLFRAPRLCFNCSSPSHNLSDCPQPHDRLAIQAGRQLYQTLKDQALASQALNDQFESSSEDDLDEEEEHVKAFSGRFWDADVQEATRLEYLERFKPGVLSEELKIALGGGDDGGATGSSEIGSWMWDGMTRWGYPPGWNNAEDPKEKARRYIQPPPETIIAGNWLDSAAPLQVYGATSLLSSLETPDDHLSSPNSDGLPSSSSSSNSSASSPPAPPSKSSSSQPPRRWAIFPTSLFSSQLLPAFSLANPIPLPPVQEIEDENARRKRIWEKLQASAGSGAEGWTRNGRREVPAGAKQILPSAFFDFMPPSDAPQYPPLSLHPPPIPPSVLPPSRPPQSLPLPPPGSPPPPPPPSPPPSTLQSRGWSPIASTSTLPRSTSKRTELPPLPSSRRDQPSRPSSSSRRDDPRPSTSRRSDSWDRYGRDEPPRGFPSSSAFSYYSSSAKRPTSRRSRSPSPPPPFRSSASTTYFTRPRSRSPPYIPLGSRSPPRSSSSLYRRDRLPSPAQPFPSRSNYRPYSPGPGPGPSSRSSYIAARRRSHSPLPPPSYGTREDPLPDGRRGRLESDYLPSSGGGGGRNYDYSLVRGGENGGGGYSRERSRERERRPRDERGTRW